MPSSVNYKLMGKTRNQHILGEIIILIALGLVFYFGISYHSLTGQTTGYVADSIAIIAIVAFFGLIM
jgi:proteasome assembly chaperone (PAC2) family protein